MKTIISEDTNVKNSTNAVESKNAPKWRQAVIGGIPGIALGAGGILIAEAFAPSALAANEPDVPVDEPLEEAPAQNDIFVPETCAIASKVNDDMTFSQAFAAARSEVGPGGVFEWHGHLYGTYYKTEWDAMSDEQKADYWEAVSEVHIENSSADEASDDTAEAAVAAEDAVEEEEVIVPDDEEEGYIEVEAEEEDAEEIIVPDDEPEPTDTPEEEIVEEEIVEDEATEVPEEDLYANNPDYTNDADTSALA